MCQLKRYCLLSCSVSTGHLGGHGHLSFTEEVSTRWMERETVQRHCLGFGAFLFVVKPGGLAFCSVLSVREKVF